MVSYKVPQHKKDQARKKTLNNQRDRKRAANVFPNCIGMFPECKEYTEDMTDEQKPECKNCPYKG